MIAKLKGTVEEIFDDSLIVDVNGVGYEVFVIASLMKDVIKGAKIELYTYHAFRQDEQFLCGFTITQELLVFKALLNVPGIGIRSALGILSNLTVEDLAVAIARQDAEVLCRAKGIGRKNAERILLELKDKNEVKLADSEKMMRNDVENDAMLALLSLGYQKKGINNAIQQVKEQNNGVELSVNEMIVQCLRML